MLMLQSECFKGNAGKGFNRRIYLEYKGVVHSCE